MTISTLPDFNPTNDQVVKVIKEATDKLLEFIETNCPNNRQRSIALTNYEQAAMWAVKSNFV